MILSLDVRHDYRGYSDCPSCCHLRVYHTQPGEEAVPPVVIATQYWDNPGTSISNMAEDLASFVWEMLGRPNGMVWIENYEPLPAEAGILACSLSRMKSEFDLVEFEPASAASSRTELTLPRWRAVSRREVEALVDQPVAPVQTPCLPSPQAA